MDAAYTLIRGLLRDSTLTSVKNKQATFDKQMADNLNRCLDAIMVHICPNKAYELQKQCIWHTMQKPRHISACRWIARVSKLNNFKESKKNPIIK
eukprot:9605384-Ditylum_brightwellii.AAC.1